MHCVVKGLNSTQDFLCELNAFSRAIVGEQILGEGSEKDAS